MKSLPYQHSGWNRFFSKEESGIGLGLVQYKFSFPNISKIKDKILGNFFVAYQNDLLNSSKYQNKGQRTYPYICDKVTIDL